MAKLKFYYGAMNCGKSTLLLQRAYNYEERGMHIATFKPAVDTKGDNKIVSRIGAERTVDHLLTATDNFYTLVKENYFARQCLLIDEAQFLQEEQVDQALRVASSFNIRVECYGLRTDYLTHSFPGSRRLLELADELIEMESRCSCGNKATLQARFRKQGIGHFEMILDGEGPQVEIDNQENICYISYCPKCYLEKTEEAIQKKLSKE